LPFAFNLTLDPNTSLEIERVYASLAALDIPERDLITQYGPCVTILVVGDHVRAALIVDVLKWKLPEMGALPVTFTEPCIIAGTPPALCLRVGPTDALLALHDMIFTELPAEEVHLHYRPAYWQPHLKLANVHGSRAADAALAARLAAKWHGLTGELNRLELLQYPPVQAIWHAPFKNAALGGGGG
jgi:hypothetical protein